MENASPGTRAAHELVRARVPFLDGDRRMDADIAEIVGLIRSGELSRIVSGPESPASSRPAASAACQLVDPSGHDEVVAGQPARGVRGERERGASPAELDVRVMALGLGEQGDARDEAECVAEIVEGELAAQRQVALALPGGSLPGKRGRLLLGQRRRPWHAYLAVRLGELAHPQRLSPGGGRDNWLDRAYRGGESQERHAEAG